MFIPDVMDLSMSLMEAVTGWTFGQQERLNASLRALNIRQAFNLREGIRPKDSVLPPRAVGKPPMSSGPLAGIHIDSDTLAHNFYLAMEWDEETGKPSRASLERLGGLENVIADLYP